MSLITIVTSIIIALGVGIGIYFIIKNKSKSTQPPVISGPAVSLAINVGKIENQL